MDEHTFSASVDGMGFELRNVMRDIIDNGQTRALTQNAFKCASYGMTNDLAIGPGKVRRARHGAKISLPLRRMNGSACQLPVGKMEIVPAHGLVQLRHVISANLMA